MLRRCLESPNRCFGMVPPPRATPATGANGTISTGNDYGTMLEIRNVQMLPDGRSFVETWGTYRFRIMDRGMRDGYMVARVERIEDYEEEEEVQVVPAAVGVTPPSIIDGNGLAPTPGPSIAPQALAAEPSATSHPLEAAVGVGIGEALVSVGSQPHASPPRSHTRHHSSSSHTSHSSDGGSRPSSAGAHVVAGREPHAGTTAEPKPIPTGPRRVPTNAELMATCHQFIEQTRQGTPWVVQHLHNINYVPMPSDPASFSFWMALVRGARPGVRRVRD